MINIVKRKIISVFNNHEYFYIGNLENKYPIARIQDMLKSIVFILKRLQKKYIKMFQNRTKNMFKSNLINMIKIL